MQFIRALLILCVSGASSTKDIAREIQKVDEQIDAAAIAAAAIVRAVGASEFSGSSKPPSTPPPPTRKVPSASSSSSKAPSPPAATFPVVDQILAKRKTKQIIQQHLADKQRVFLTLLAKSKRAHEHDRIPPAKSKALHEIDGLFQRLLADKSSFGDVHVLSDVRSFLARDAALLLRDNGGPPRTAAWEKSTLAAAIARYDEASEAKAWESGGVYSSVSVLKQSKVDGVAGMHAAAVLHLGGTPATNALGQKFRTSLYGSASPSPVSSPPFTPWWDSAKCAALTASPPPEILALRALHAKTSSFKSKSGRIVAPMLGGASTNNRREVNELVFVLAYLTGRTFVLDEVKNSDFWLYDRADWTKATRLVVDAAAKQTAGMKVRGFGGDRQESKSIAEWIEVLSQEKYVIAGTLSPADLYANPTWVLQLDRTLLAKSVRPHSRTTVLLDHMLGVFRHCVHVSSDMWTHATRLRSILPPHYFAINARHKLFLSSIKNSETRGTLDAPLFDCGRLGAHGWTSREVPTYDNEPGLRRVPCSFPNGKERVDFTLADAVALLNAPSGATVYIASWHPEPDLEASIRTLGYNPVSYMSLMKPYFHKYRELPPLALFHHVGVEELILAFASQYVADWPSSVTESVVAQQRHMAEQQMGGTIPSDMHAFQPFTAAENWRAFVQLTKVAGGFGRRRRRLRGGP